ncbi:disks large homolog 4-like, partial [Phalacrocorax carbo]|uniref:disks large homolog 4-like n=1 Tax=Phalacrocorax carbo TaxID=9209 RepID=UPI00311A217D
MALGWRGSGALRLLEEALGPPPRLRAQQLLGVLQSPLFQALLDIQESYEATVAEAPPAPPRLRVTPTPPDPPDRHPPTA